MKSKRTGKSVFFIILVLIFALTFAAFFGIENYYGDTRKVYIKGASDIRWGIDISGGVEAVFTPDISDIDITKEDMASAKTIIETRLVNNNITDYEVFADEANHQIIVRFPWAAGSDDFDAQAAIAELGQTAELTFCKGTAYDANNVIFNGKHVKAATPGVNQETGEYLVQLELDSEAAGVFESATRELAGNGNIAICMDGQVFSAPSVKQTITGGVATISPMEDAEAAEKLANTINAGALPFTMSVDDSKLQVISPSLGANALNVMLIAGAIAFALVCILMIVRYRLHGVIASVSLLGQLAGTIAAISGFFPGVNSFTLTVPGIAGIILSVGVGVDCNVISAERIRDEFKNGKTIDGAVEAGFKHSLSAIIDGNVTIVIVALVLMGAFGTASGINLIAYLFSWTLGASITGSIYSFGYTLLVGVIFNLIMGVLASKYMLKSASQLKFLRKPWLYGGKKNG